MPKGTWRVGGALTGGALRDTPMQTSTPYAIAELSARRGITDDLDVGARLYTAGVDASATWRFAHGCWSWALAPDLAGVRTRDTGIQPPALDLFAQTAVVASRNLSHRWTLNLGPTVGGGLYWPITGGHATGVWLGGFVGAGARAGEWIFAPEFGVLRVVTGDVPVDGAGLQLGVAVTRDL